MFFLLLLLGFLLVVIQPEEEEEKYRQKLSRWKKNLWKEKKKPDIQIGNLG